MWRSTPWAVTLTHAGLPKSRWKVSCQSLHGIGVINNLNNPLAEPGLALVHQGLLSTWGSVGGDCISSCLVQNFIWRDPSLRTPRETSTLCHGVTYKDMMLSHLKLMSHVFLHFHAWHPTYAFVSCSVLLTASRLSTAWSRVFGCQVTKRSFLTLHS